MHPCDSYFSPCRTLHGKDDPEATLLKRAKMRSDERRDIDSYSHLKDLTSATDRMLVGLEAAPPTTCIDVLLALREQTSLIARTDELMSRAVRATTQILADTVLRARVLYNGAGRADARDAP